MIRLARFQFFKGHYFVRSILSRWIAGWISTIPLFLIILLVSLATPSYADEIVGGGASPASPADSAYRKGVAALAFDKVGEAEADFKKALQLDPKNVRALEGLAEVAIRRNDAKGALAPLQKAASLAPNDAGIKTAYGHYLFWQKRYTEAEAALKKAAQMDPRAARPHYELGDLYLIGLHQPKAAIEAYRASIALDPKDSRVRYALGRALLDAGQFDQAQAQLEEAVRLAPKNPLMSQALGDCYAKRNQIDKALDSYGKALAIEPKFLPAYMARGDIFASKGQTEKALAEFQAASKAAPKFAPAFLKLGLLEQQANHLDEAERAYRTAVSLDPKEAIGFNNLAWIAVQRKGNLDESLKFAKKAVELAPKVTGFQDTLAWVYRARGEQDQAIAILEKAAGHQPPDPNVLYHLGVIYADKGSTRLALDNLNKALATKRDFDGAADARSRVATLSRTTAN